MAINLKGSDDSSFSNSLNVRDINAVNTGENSIFLGYDGSTLNTQIWANGTIITSNSLTAAAAYLDRKVAPSSTTLTVEANGTRGLQIFGDGTTHIGGTLTGNVTTDSPNILLGSGGGALFTNEVTVKQELSPSFASPAFSVSNSSQDEVIRLNNDGSASFNGDVTAANITSFKTTLTSAVASAADLAALKTAITNALAQL